LGYQGAVRRDRGRHPGEDPRGHLGQGGVGRRGLGGGAVGMEALVILVGGDETTRHVLSGGVYQLLRHPEQVALLTRDPGRIPTAVEEMLRWVSPIQNMARTAARDVEVRGECVRAGQKVLLLYPSAKREA